MLSELKASLIEAVAIESGNMASSREFSYAIVDVKSIRSQLNASQQEFATVLGISVDTLESWEAKSRLPTGLSAKVLATIRDNPEFYRALASH